MNPSYFGSAARQLYGMYHPPLAEAPRDVGVLLCYPGAQEYLYSHWAFRQLATQLTRAGFHVLRFDYFGTGDSAGASDEGTVAQWQEDVATAAQELKDLAGVSRISAVGLRLGAALAAAASAKGLALEDLVLWEPVVSGAAYVQELRELEVRKGHASRQPPPAQAEVLLGYPFPARLREELAAVDLLSLGAPEAARTVVVVSKEQPAPRALEAHLQRRGARTEYLQIGEAAGGDRTDSALLSDRALRAMTAVLAGRPS